MKDIVDWLNNPHKNFDTGVAILAKYHKNKIFVNLLAKNKSNSAMDKLIYELGKFINKKDIIIPQKVVNVFPQPTVIPKPKPQKKIPNIIQQAKNEIFDLFNQISILHRELFDLGESNDKNIVTKRKTILEKRLPLIELYEQLYLEKEKYFVGGEISPSLTILLNKKMTLENNEPLNEVSFEKMSDIELVSKQHSLKVNINKHTNKLNYQSTKKLSSPCPMPEGPLREKTIAKINLLSQELQQINLLIEKRKKK